MTERQKIIIQKFLTYSFSPIEGNYNDLTAEEKTFCSETEFVELVAWATTESQHTVPF